MAYKSDRAIFDRLAVVQFQLTTSQKKRKLSESLFIEEGEDEEVVAHDVDNYLDRLFTLLLAHSMASCAGVTGAPDAAQEFSLGADTTKYQSQAQHDDLAHVPATPMAPSAGR